MGCPRQKIVPVAQALTHQRALIVEFLGGVPDAPAEPDAGRTEGDGEEQKEELRI